MSSDEDYLTLEIKEPEIPLDYHRKRTRKLNQQSITKSKKIRLQEELDEKLQQEIPSDNKGFKMLQKMGFQPGTGTAPITIQLKSDKLGIGSTDPHELHKYESIAEKQEKKLVMERKQVDFGVNMRNKFEYQLLEKDLKSARQTCMSLDIDHEIERHCFWPVDEKVLVSFQGYDTKLVNEPIDMFETEKDEFVKFQMVNDYIRNTYHYCIWCGCKYDSAQELKLECPGNTRKDHDE